MATQQLVFRELDWKKLITKIDAGGVVPIVGPELLKITMDGREMLLQEYLARELAQRLKFEVAENASLNEVVSAYRVNNDPSDAYFVIWEILEGKLPTPEPLRQLAEIDKLQLFVSTTFDGLMTQALNEVRFGGDARTIPHAYRKPGPGEDVAKLETAPIVYQLFGKVSTEATFVLTQEDLLAFGRLWQNQDHRPPGLTSLLKDKYLVMLGCSFPDWFARFMLCAMKPYSLFTGTAERNGVIADEQSRSDKELMLFLSRCNTHVYPDGGGVEFVRELSKRWKEHVANSAPAARSPNADPDSFVPGSIFISYASEDRKIAAQLSAALEAQGLDVWYDRKQLESGDDYRAKILHNIERSSFFVPVISEHVLTPDRRFFRLEWTHAIEELPLRPRGVPFLLPFAIDDTRSDAPLIPPEFKNVQWERVSAGGSTDNFVELCRRRVRSLRRQEVKA